MTRNWPIPTMLFLLRFALSIDNLEIEELHQRTPSLGCTNFTSNFINEATNNRITFHQTNNRARTPSKESPFDVLLTSHIRETHSSCSPYQGNAPISLGSRWLCCWRQHRTKFFDILYFTTILQQTRLTDEVSGLQHGICEIHST